MVGIPEPERRVKQYPHELSGGQRQRVVIAMAISCDPRVIIADEPTTALDVTVQADILDLLRSLKDKLNTGILLITHNMGVVADMADRVAVMFKGELVEQGTAEEVLVNPQHDYTKMLLGSVPRLGRRPRPDGHQRQGRLRPGGRRWPSTCATWSSSTSAWASRRSGRSTTSASRSARARSSAWSVSPGSGQVDHRPMRAGPHPRRVRGVPAARQGHHHAEQGRAQGDPASHRRHLPGPGRLAEPADADR